MLTLTLMLAMLGTTPPCIPASEETLIMFHPERPVCEETRTEVNHGSAH